MVSSSYDFGMTVIPKKTKKIESSLCSEFLAGVNIFFD